MWFWVVDIWQGSFKQATEVNSQHFGWPYRWHKLPMSAWEFGQIVKQSWRSFVGWHKGGHLESTHRIVICGWRLCWSLSTRVQCGKVVSMGTCNYLIPWLKIGAFGIISLSIRQPVLSISIKSGVISFGWISVRQQQTWFFSGRFTKISCRWFSGLGSLSRNLVQRPPKLLTHRWWKGTQSVLIWCHEVLVKAKCRSIGHCQVFCVGVVVKAIWFRCIDGGRLWFYHVLPEGIMSGFQGFKCMWIFVLQWTARGQLWCRDDGWNEMKQCRDNTPQQLFHVELRCSWLCGKHIFRRINWWFLRCYVVQSHHASLSGVNATNCHGRENVW